MAWEITEIDDNARHIVLDTEESHTADLKAREVTPAKLTKAMSAFANAEGGELFVGIDEDRSAGIRTWRGFDSIEDATGIFRR